MTLPVLRQGPQVQNMVMERGPQGPGTICCPTQQKLEGLDPAFLLPFTPYKATFVDFIQLD